MKGAGVDVGRALDQIAAEASALDLGAAAAGDPGDLTPPAASNAEEWAKLPEIFGGLICMALPKLKPAYSTENCLAWGREMDKVATAHGWDVAVVLAKLGPWVGLVVASLPMAVPTVLAVREARAAGRSGFGTLTGDSAAAPAVSPGPVPHPVGMLQPIE